MAFVLPCLQIRGKKLQCPCRDFGADALSLEGTGSMGCWNGGVHTSEAPQEHFVNECTITCKALLHDMIVIVGQSSTLRERLIGSQCWQVINQGPIETIYLIWVNERALAQAVDPDSLASCMLQSFDQHISGSSWMQARSSKHTFSN